MCREEGRKVRSERRVQEDFRTSSGMREAQRLSMQGLTRERVSGGRAEGSSLLRIGLRDAVQTVAQKRMPERFGMHADLVLSPGLRKETDEGQHGTPEKCLEACA